MTERLHKTVIGIAHTCVGFLSADGEETEAKRGLANLLIVTQYSGLPWWLRRKASACNVGDPGSIPGLRRCPEGGNALKKQPAPVLLPGKSHGQRSLVGCSPWGRRVGHD